jgi:hypothetical protein
MIRGATELVEVSDELRALTVRETAWPTHGYAPSSTVGCQSASLVVISNLP